MDDEANGNDGGRWCKLPEKIAAALRAISHDQRHGRTGAMALETIMRAWFAEKEATGRVPNLRPVNEIGRQLGLDVETTQRIANNCRTHAESQRRVNYRGILPRGCRMGRTREWVITDEDDMNAVRVARG